MRVRKGRLPLIHLSKEKPDWVHSNGYLTYGILLKLSLNLNTPTTEFEETRVSYYYIYKRKKQILRFLNNDRSMELLNDYSLEKICRTLNVNVIIMARYQSLTKEIFNYRDCGDLETVYLHCDEAKFNKNDYSSMALIYDIKESADKLTIIYSKIRLSALLKSYLEKDKMTFMECLAAYSDQSVSEIAEKNEASYFVLGEERDFFEKFGFGYRIITKTQPEAIGTYKPRPKIKIVHRSLYENFVLLQYVLGQWPSDKEIINEYDKFVLLPLDSIPVHECQFGCEYSSTRRRDVQRHEIKCTMETVMRTKQIALTDPDPRDWLVENNYVAHSSIVKEFVTYDIETLMIPTGNGIKEHKCLMIALAKNFGSEPRSLVIKRASLDEVGYNEMLDKFYKTLQEFLVEYQSQSVPKEYRNALLSIYETYSLLKDNKITLHPKFRAGMYQAKNYLEKICRMKVFGYNSERFDLPILFPGLLKLLKKNGEEVDTIKNGSGIMQISTSQIVFMDVMRFVAGGSLDKFAKTWSAEEVKGIFPYELFRSIEALHNCRTWPKLEHFYSSLNLNNRNVQKVADKLQKSWNIIMSCTESNTLKQLFSNRLCLDKYFVNSPESIPDNFNFHTLLFREDKNEDSFTVDPVLYVENWIDFTQKLKSGECESMMDFYSNYCSKDASILAQAFSNYCSSFVKHHGVNPLDSPSLPSMASRILWLNYDKTINKPYSFGKDWLHLNREIRKNIMGGLSIVFCRHAEVNTPRIYDEVVHTVPNGDPIKKIECVDFNSKTFLTNHLIMNN